MLALVIFDICSIARRRRPARPSRHYAHGWPEPVYSLIANRSAVPSHVILLYPCVGIGCTHAWVHSPFVSYFV